MPGNKTTFLHYSEDAMKAAVEDVRQHKISIRAAAKKFAVPRTTLKYKLEGKSPMVRKMGPPSILTSKEEAEISKWVEDMAQAGFPVTVEQLCISVEKYIREVKRDTPFKDGRPGRTWVIGFLRRNCSISKRVSQNLTVSRAVVTREDILNWFSEVEAYIEKEYGEEKILEDPTRIFNCDETAFFLNTKGPKILAKKGHKTVYQKVNVDEEECVTVLITGNASGVIAPITCLYKYKRIPQEIAENFPKEWGLGKTDSGWMTCEAFFEFISAIFYPWLVKKEITFPVILFVDGHASYLCLQTTQFCKKNRIILIAMLPSATHLLQPMDVAVFKSLKEGWRKKVHQWRMDNVIQGSSYIIKEKKFAKLLEEVIFENITESFLSNGFKKCGLYPWNPQAVLIPGQGTSKEQDECKSTKLKTQYLKRGLHFLNDMIGREKVNIFEASNDAWNGDPLDTSLFKLWKKTKMELHKLSSKTESWFDGEINSNMPLKDDASDILADGKNVNQGSVTDMDVSSIVEPIDLDKVQSVRKDFPQATDSDVISDSTRQHDLLKVTKASTSLMFESCTHYGDNSENEENVAGLLQAEIPSPFKRHFFYPAFEGNQKKGS